MAKRTNTVYILMRMIVISTEGGSTTTDSLPLLLSGRNLLVESGKVESATSHFKLDGRRCRGDERSPLTRKIHRIFMRLSNTNKFEDLKIPKFGVFLPVPPTKVGADSYNSLRFYMNKAG